MERTQLDTYCGLYCGSCPDDDKTCPGCKAPNTENPECQLRLCCVGKKLENCSECSDFPCAKVDKMAQSQWSHHRTALPNLQRIKSIGIKAWLIEQDKGSRCTKCGKRIFWYRDCCKT